MVTRLFPTKIIANHDVIGGKESSNLSVATLVISATKAQPEVMLMMTTTTTTVMTTSLSRASSLLANCHGM